MMKKLTITTIAAVSLLASCTVETDAVEQAPVTTEEKVVVTVPQISPDENFLNGMSSDFPGEVAMLGKSRILDLGRTTCQAIDEGSTISDFADMAVQTGVDAGFVGALIREAVENFCPENQWFIDSALSA
jgi:hypothetical protein